MLSRKDKTAMLERLIKSIRHWERGRSTPVLLLLGQSELSANSSAFQEWRDKAHKAIELIFGEHSHYLADFDEIQYSDIVTALLQDKKASETKFWEGVGTAKRMLETMIEEIKASGLTVPGVPAVAAAPIQAPVNSCVFIGHGRSPLWAIVKLFLQNELGLKTVCFESESRAGETVGEILNEMLGEASFAVLILTAEDETADGSKRARQNVIHEVGLFQSKLGAKKAILLRQDGIEDFTNAAGLQYISFTDNKIEQTFYQLQKALKREGLI